MIILIRVMLQIFMIYLAQKHILYISTYLFMTVHVVEYFALLACTRSHGVDMFPTKHPLEDNPGFDKTTRLRMDF